MWQAEVCSRFGVAGFGWYPRGRLKSIRVSVWLGLGGIRVAG